MTSVLKYIQNVTYIQGKTATTDVTPGKDLGEIHCLAGLRTFYENWMLVNKSALLYNHGIFEVCKELK